MNDDHLPDDDVLRLVFGELDAKRQAAVRKAVAEDAELAATARGLEAAVVAVRAENVGQVSDDFNDRLRRQMPDIFDCTQAESARPTFLTRSLDTWRWIMRSPVSRVTAAAIFVLAVTGVAVWFHGSGATPVFADFLEPILEAKTVRCKVTTEFTAQSVQMKLLPEAMQRDLRKTTSEVMMLGATRMRRETVNPDKSKTIHIWDGGQGKRISLLPAQKRAEVFDDANKRSEKTPNGGDPVAAWRSMLLDAHDRPDVKREPLGEKVIDGRQVVGFRISSPAAVFEVWGDPKTGLPARVGWTTAAVPDVKVTMSDFEFNVDMDESLFSVEPPAGYEVGSFFISTPIIDGSTTKETDLIETLGEYSRLSRGPFPAALDMESITGIVRMEFSGGRLQKPGAQEEIAEIQAKLQPGLMFSVVLPKEADAHYAGKGVSLGAADTPIFWYRPKDAKTYRVIYADLSVRDADAPPSVPDALPEQDLIDTFRYYSELSGGPFPDSLDMASFLQNVAMKSLSFDSLEQRDKASLKQMQETLQARMTKDLVKFKPGLIFTASLPPEADAHYAGKGVSLGAADTPIFWYRPKDAKAYRVVYADLSVRDAETPPSVPDAQPEEDLIDTFRYYSELSGGPFPDSLDLQTMTEVIGRDFAIRMFLELAPGKEERHKIEELMSKSMDLHELARETGKPNKEQTDKIQEQIRDLVDWGRLAPGEGKPNKEQMTKIIEAETQKFMKAQMPKLMAATTRLQRGLLFTTQLPPEADAHYAGKGVSLGAADTPIFWYRPKDAKTYRVIYDDLSVRDAETPPGVRDAQPVPAPSSPKK
jgi:outer membrane lipoprotein-sorting protein